MVNRACGCWRPSARMPVRSSAPSGEAEEILTRHAEYFVDLAERAEPQFVRSGPAHGFARLERERGNFLALERWALRADVTPTASCACRRVVAVLDGARRRWRSARSYSGDPANGRPGTTVGNSGPWAPRGGCARRAAGRLRAVRSLLEKSLAVARAVGDLHALATALDSLGRQQFIEGRYVEARALLEESHVLLRELNDRVGLARVLSHAGFLEYLEGHPDAARAIFERRPGDCPCSRRPPSGRRVHGQPGQYVPGPGRLRQRGAYVRGGSRHVARPGSCAVAGHGAVQPGRGAVRSRRARPGAPPSRGVDQHFAEARRSPAARIHAVRCRDVGRRRGRR